MKALFVAFTILAFACIGCESKVSKAEAEIKNKTPPAQSRLDTAKAACDSNGGKLMYGISFSAFGTKPYYHSFRCIPEGVQVRIEE